MQMKVVAPQERSFLAMVFPKFKGMPGKEGDNWRSCPLATILLDKSTSFRHRHQRLNNKTLTPVNLGDRPKTNWFKNQTCPHPIRMINKKLKFQSLGPAC
jgi:hypothetical protein